MSNSQRVPLSTAFCKTSVASRYSSRRRLESLSLKSLITWKWSKTIFALGRWVMTAPQYAADMSMATASILG